MHEVVLTLWLVRAYLSTAVIQTLSVFLPVVVLIGLRCNSNNISKK